LRRLDRVLDGQRLALLHLLGQRNAGAALLVVLAEIALEEFLELVEHGLEDTSAGVGKGLHDLDHALDFRLQRRAEDLGRRPRSP
jgi:hypothetical protein